ncbi:MAG: hypothetical protein GYA88_01225 [Clostridiales bacterium]|jgi:Fe2+ transport system protein FeoA|nr:hypothetical protein [Clostridiales bacterium]
MKNLYEVEDKKDYKIEKIPTAGMLATIGIIPGSVVRKERTYGMGGPVYIKLGTRSIAIGKKISLSVMVEEV